MPVIQQNLAYLNGTLWLLMFLDLCFSYCGKPKGLLWKMVCSVYWLTVKAYWGT